MMATLPPPSPGRGAIPNEADIACAEAIQWQAVADAQVLNILATNLQYADEVEGRSRISAEMSVELAQIMNRMAIDAAIIRTQTNERANAAATEVLRWSEIASQLATETQLQKEKANVQERAMREEFALKQSMMEHELTAKSDLTGAQDSLRDDVNQLRNQKSSLERNVRDLQEELSAIQTSLQAHKIASLDEKQALDQQVQSVRHQLAVERANLQQVKSQQDHVTQMTISASSPGPGARPASPVRAASPDARQPGGAPSTASVRLTNGTLASGLAALQNVREQLKEMREASASANAANISASPARTQSAAQLGGGAPQSPGDNSVGDIGGLRHANSYSFGSDASGPGSPWKARLMKLQGDLKSLRSELGTSSPEFR